MASLFSTPLVRGHKESYLPPIVSQNHAKQLAAGPFLMAAIAGLELLRRRLTETKTSDLYSHIWKFISKSEARDKSGRIVQYFCRFLQGALAHLPASFPLQPYKAVIAEVQSTLAWARRTHRWGKEMPHLPVLGEAICKGDVLEIAQRSVLITFLIQDHIYWLLKVGILKFQNYTAIQWHRRNLRFITLSHVLNFSLCVRDIKRIREKQALKDAKYSGTEAAESKAAKDIYDNQRMMVRYVLTFFQMLHVSQVIKMDDWYIGLMGVASSYIDASKQW